MKVILRSGQHLHLPRSKLTRVDGVPAGSRVIVRILVPLPSHKNKAGDKSAFIPASL